jgi:hypothetical protein
LVNVAKPLHVDDAAYYYYAKQIAHHPLDPYGFEVFWYEDPEPAMEVLAPPVLPYWWSLAVRIDGERVWVWKLWLFPFSLLLIVSVYGLCRRFARGLEMPLVWMTVLSPALLPSTNLMLDVPALALSLTAVQVFLWACDRRSMLGATLAGLTAGLAMETKYTGILSLATLLIYAWLFRRGRLGIVAVAVALCAFASWESFIAWRYGTSHFLLHAHHNYLPDATYRYGRGWPKFLLAGPLVTLLGGVSPALAALGMKAMGQPKYRIVILVLLTGLVYGLTAWVGGVDVTHWLPRVSWCERLRRAVPPQRMEFFLFGALGWVTLVVLTAVCCILCRRARWGRAGERSLGRARRISWFLVLWLAVEVAGYFSLTPFPAVRRLLGIFVVGTLLVGRLAARTCRTSQRRRFVWGLVCFGLLQALVVGAVDFCDARARQDAVANVTDWLRDKRKGDEMVWYIGHWGWQFYAERQGWQPVAAWQSTLRAGDWLVVPSPSVEGQHLDLGVLAAERFDLVVVRDDWIPFTTLPAYYGGMTVLRQCEEPRLQVNLYRILEDCVPVSSGASE